MDEIRKRYERQNPKSVAKAKYAEYLRSNEWWTIRNKVMDRDNHICQGCLTNRAEHVHHTTYANIFNEFCFQLISVCNDCHKRLHNK